MPENPKIPGRNSRTYHDFARLSGAARDSMAEIRGCGERCHRIQRFLGRIPGPTTDSPEIPERLENSPPSQEQDSFYFLEKYDSFIWMLQRENSDAIVVINATLISVNGTNMML